MAVDGTILSNLLTAAIVAEGGAAKATGTIALSDQPSAGVHSAGSIQFNGQLVEDETMTIGGVAYTFKDSAGAAPEIQIGSDLPETLDNIVTVLNASAEANVLVATYSEDGTDTLNVVHDDTGDNDGAPTLATDQAGATVTATTGGSAGDSVTVNGVKFPVVANGSVQVTHLDLELGATVDATLANMETTLNASVHADVAVATYTADTDDDEIDIEYDTAGTAGNSFTLAKSGANITVPATLSGGTATGATGSLNAVGSGGGEIVATRHDDTFEDQTIAVMGVIEFLLESTANPATSNTTYVQARQQRKVLIDVLEKMSAKIATTVGTTDTRATDAARVRTAGINVFNKAVRPDGL